MNEDYKAKNEEALERAKAVINASGFQTASARTHLKSIDLHIETQEGPKDSRLMNAIIEYYGRYPEDSDKLVAAAYFYNLGAKAVSEEIHDKLEHLERTIRNLFKI